MSDTLVFDRIQTSLTRLRVPRMGEILERVMRATEEGGELPQIKCYRRSAEKWNDASQFYRYLVKHTIIQMLIGQPCFCNIFNWLHHFILENLQKFFPGKR